MIITKLLVFLTFSGLVDTFHIEIFKKPFEDGDSVLLGINFSPYMLVFKKIDDEFVGGIKIEFTGFSESGKKNFVRFIKRINFQTYEETRKKENRLQFLKWLIIKENIKKAEVKISDLNSDREWKYVRKWKLYKNVRFSDPFFVKRDYDSIIYLVPPIRDSSFQILWKFITEKEGYVNIEIFDEDEEIKKDEFKIEDNIIVKNYKMNLKKIKNDKILFKIRFLSKEGKKFYYERAFYVKPLSIFSIYEWKDLLSALNILFPRNQLDTLYKAKENERKRVWDAFWKKYDPNPVTPYNELEIEFLNRFRYVMKHFSSVVKGYRTDRGRIYIKYGPPDFIEDHPYEWGTYPYQIWYYNTYGLRFLFVDKTGFGEYELVTDIREIYPQF